MIYYLMYTCTYLLSLFKTHKKIQFYWCCFLCLFLTTTYMNGSDWRQYEIFYKYLTISNFGNYWHEKGFALYAAVSKMIYDDFWMFFIITKIIIFIIFVKTINTYSKNKMLVWMFFIPTSGLYLFIDCPFRNLIAIGIFLNAIKYIETRKIKRYFLLILTASLFHKSALIMLMLYFINLKNLSKKKITLIIGICFFIISEPTILKLILTKLPLYQDKIRSYILIDSKYAQGSIFSLGNLEKLFVLFLVLYNKNKILQQKYGEIIYNFFIIGIIVYKFAVSIEILGRYLLYINIFYILMIDLLIYIIIKNNLKFLYITIIYIYGLLLMNLKLNHYVYKNYNSYITYIFKEKPDFIERSNFNMKTEYKELEKTDFFKED